MKRRNASDAFILLLNKYIEKNGANDSLENLYNSSHIKLEKYIRKNIYEYNLTKDEFIKILKGEQENSYINLVFKNNILNFAYEAIGNDGKTPLGIYVDSKSNFNSSFWINHVLQVADFAADLASSIGLDSEEARKLGILHDIGRTDDHTFAHTWKGYEILKKEGWDDEAYITLTHSHLGGNFVANNEVPPSNLTVDEDGKVKWDKEDSKLYTVFEFLNKRENTDYDLVIQLSDLLVEQIGKVDIKARLEGIKSRRESKGINLDEQSNRKLFLLELYNQLKNIMIRIDISYKVEIDTLFPILDYKKANLEDIKTSLFSGENSLSLYFSKFYDDKIKEKSRK